MISSQTTSKSHEFRPLALTQDSRRRLAFVLLVIGILAGSLGVIIVLAGGGRMSVSQWFLGAGLALVNLSLIVLLFFRKIRLEIAEIGAVVVFVFTQLVNMVQFALSHRFYQDGFSGTAIWYTTIYPLCYLMLPHKWAVRLSYSSFGVAVVMSIVAALIDVPAGKVNGSGINSVVQFLFGNLLDLILLNLYAQYRYRYYHLQRLAYTDALTGLANRHTLEPLIREEIARARNQNQPLSVMMIDIDHFKRVNDTYGHRTGDLVLQQLAQLLNKNARTLDTVGRLGGEEFLALCPNSTLEQAQFLANQMCQSVADTVLEQNIKITVSIGVAEYQALDTLESFLVRADEALYRAKSLGRNRVELASTPALVS
jgi:diguanylate cyclase (GGDEF)-like protein